MASPLVRIGMTGIASDLGRGVLPLLEADARVERVVAFDVAPAPSGATKVDVVRIDLTHPGIEPTLTQALRDARIDVLLHLAFVNSRVHKAAFAHTLEVSGTTHVLAAVGAAHVSRLVVPSLTILYGAQRQGAAFMPERQPLQPCPGSRFINDRVDVEHQLEAFTAHHPDTRVQVLRFAPVIGPHCDNPFTRLLRTGAIPTVMGFDPLWQVVHETDAARALHLAVHSKGAGVFNIVGDGVLPLTSVIRHAGARAIPLPSPLLRMAVRALEAAGATAPHGPLLDFFRYSWLADGQRASRELGFLARMPAAAAVASVAAPEVSS